MNSGAGAATPLARWASASGACSWRSSSTSQRVGALQRGARAVVADVDAHRQRVDERAQRAIGPGAALHPPEQQRAEHDVAPPGGPGQHQRPGQVHDARGADPQPARDLADRRRDRRVERPPGLDQAAAAALDLEHAERRGRLVDVAQHLAEPRVVLVLARAPPRLGHEVAERRRPRQLAALPAPDRARLLDQQLQRRVIADQVVGEDVEQPAAVGLAGGRVAREQRRAADVHAVARRMVQRLELLGEVAVAGVKRHDLDRQPGTPADDLDRLVEPFPGKPGAQDVVAVDHLLQRGDEAVEPLLGVEPEHRGQQVGIARGRAAGAGTGCLPAAARAGRCRATLAAPPSTPATIASSDSCVSSTSVTWSGVIRRGALRRARSPRSRSSSASKACFSRFSDSPRDWSIAPRGARTTSSPRSAWMWICRSSSSCNKACAFTVEAPRRRSPRTGSRRPPGRARSDFWGSGWGERSARSRRCGSAPPARSGWAR